MPIPAAPLELNGDKILFVVYDVDGVPTPLVIRGYRPVTVDDVETGELGVYSTSGSLRYGNRNAVNTTRLQLSTSSIPCQGVLVKARAANVNDVWVGDYFVTADTNETNGGWRLAPGESVGVPCRNVDQVYLRWAAYTAGDGVEWIASADE